MNLFRKFIAKDKNIAINLGQIINPFGFSVLQRCTTYLQLNNTGNPIHFIKNIQEIIQKVPSEVLIFKQKARPRNLGNPKAIAFFVAENHLELSPDNI